MYVCIPLATILIQSLASSRVRFSFRINFSRNGFILLCVLSATRYLFFFVDPTSGLRGNGEDIVFMIDVVCVVLLL